MRLVASAVFMVSAGLFGEFDLDRRMMDAVLRGRKYLGKYTPPVIVNVKTLLRKLVGSAFFSILSLYLPAVRPLVDG